MLLFILLGKCKVNIGPLPVCSFQMTHSSIVECTCMCLLIYAASVKKIKGTNFYYYFFFTDQVKLGLKCYKNKKKPASFLLFVLFLFLPFLFFGWKVLLPTEVWNRNCCTRSKRAIFMYLSQ